MEQYFNATWKLNMQELEIVDSELLNWSISRTVCYLTFVYMRLMRTSGRQYHSAKFMIAITFKFMPEKLPQNEIPSSGIFTVSYAMSMGIP